MFILKFVVLTICTAVCSAKFAPFPKQLIRCQKNDTHLNECLQNALQEALPYLAKGIPEAGILPLDPIFTKKINLIQNYGPVQLNATFLNFDIIGISKAKIKSVRADVENYRFTVTADFSKLISVGSYKVRATVLGLPLEGEGTHKFTLEGAESTVSIYGERQSRSGTDFFKVKDVTCNVDTKTIRFDLKNLFNGNEILGRQANIFLNRFSNAIFVQVKDIGGEALAKIYAEIAKGFYNKVPYSEIYE